MPARLRLSLLLVACLVATVQAGEIIDIRASRAKNHFLLHSEIMINAPRHKVMAAITDYEHLAELDQGIVESKITERIDENAALVLTRIKGCILLFCRTVQRLERVTRFGDDRIEAVIVAGKLSDFLSGESSWLLSDTADGTRVVYTSRIDLDFWIPPLVGPRLLSRTLKKHISALVINLEQ